MIDTKELAKQSIAIMDERGCHNPENNSMLLWDIYWKRLRNNLLEILDQPTAEE